MNLGFRYVLLFVTAMGVALSSRAVLPEDNIDRTMVMLSEDMKVLQHNITRDLKLFNDRLTDFHNEVSHLNDICDEAGLVLYTQDERYLYGTLQATQRMREVTRWIYDQGKDIVQLDKELSSVSSRYNKLSAFLEKLKSRDFSPEGRRALISSQAIADSLHTCINNSILKLHDDKASYDALVAKSNALEKYNDEVMSQLHNRIFIIGNETFPDILAHFSSRLDEFIHDLKWRFLTGQSDTDDWNSIEDRMYDLLDIFMYIAIAVGLIFYFITWFKKLFPKWIRDKRAYYALLVGLTVKVLGFFAVQMFMGSSHQIDVILTIESELYLLVLLVTTSITIRLVRKKILKAIVGYLPMFITTFFMIEYREDLVPISTVTFTAPFIFMLAMIVQMAVLIPSRHKLDAIDRRICRGNLIITAICFILTYRGYTILSTMLYLFWIGIVNGVMLVALGKVYLTHRNMANDTITKLTLVKLIYPLVFPSIMILSLLWVAHIYNLTSWFGDLLATPFIDMPDRIGVISVSKVLYIYSLGICVNYILCLVKTLIQQNTDNRQGQVAVAITIGNIIVWLLYVAAVMIILDVNRGGLIAAIGGASVGIGFALKDTFENFFCGMSLMAGRARPGDILEYEGVRGKVLDVGIISTRLETEDGPIMAMPNRQLFEKNFKNMTRNQQVEIRHISFDISADNDMDFVRGIILDSFHGIDGVDDTRKHVVVMRNFGCSILRVELKVWVDTEKYLVAEPAVREAVFKTFRDNGIQAASLLNKIDTDTSSSIMEDNNIL